MHADQYTALPLFLSTSDAALDLPPVPDLNTLPMLRPDREPEQSMFDWCVESLDAARAWKEEAEALSLQNRYLRDQLAQAHAREYGRRRGVWREALLTLGAVTVAACVLLASLNALP